MPDEKQEPLREGNIPERPSKKPAVKGYVPPPPPKKPPKKPASDDKSPEGEH